MNSEAFWKLPAPVAALGEALPRAEAAAVPALLGWIAEAGHPAAITGPLLDLAAGERHGPAARQVIGQLLAAVPVREFPRLDERMRQWTMNGSLWPKLSPASVKHLGLATGAARRYVALVASHPRGLVREAALHRLAGVSDAGLIPYLLVRVTDWAAPVAAVAGRRLAEYLRPEFAGELLGCAALVAHLAAGTRWVATAGQLDALLTAPACAPAIMAAFDAEADAVRRWAFALALRNPACDPAAAVRRAAADRDARIRRWAQRAGVAAVPGLAPELRTAAAVDPVTAIRRIALEAAASDLAREEAAVRRFLFDRAAGLRQEARVALAGLLPESPAAFYREALATDLDPGRLAGALGGLAETGGPADAERLTAYLRHERAAVRRAGVEGLARLGEATAPGRLLEMLADEGAGAARASARLLLRARAAEPAAVWETARRRRSRFVAVSVLRELWKMAPWDHLQIALALAAGNESEWGRQHLRNWTRSRQTPTRPPSPERRAALLAEWRRSARTLPPGLARDLEFMIRTAIP